MVERLKAAIEKARESRGAAQPAGAMTPEPGWPAGAAPAGGAVAEIEARARAEYEPWLALDPITLDPRGLVRERIITRDKADPAHTAFDALRTRLLKALSDNGWFRVAVTSPSKGCGKTMVAANLAFSLARQPEVRSILIDFDMRMPRLAHVLGQRGPHAVEPYLTGEVPAGEFLRRVGDNLAVGLNTVRAKNAAELVQSRRTGRALKATWETFRPHVVLFDTPPMLAFDDVLALLPNIDCVLLVVGGGQTRAAEIEECERLMAEHTNFLGIVLNKAEDNGARTYRYYES